MHPLGEKWKSMRYQREDPPRRAGGPGPREISSRQPTLVLKGVGWANGRGWSVSSTMPVAPPAPKISIVGNVERMLPGSSGRRRRSGPGPREISSRQPTLVLKGVGWANGRGWSVTISLLIGAPSPQSSTMPVAPPAPKISIVGNVERMLPGSSGRRLGAPIEPHGWRGG
jgi:hypothetical protein